MRKVRIAFLHVAPIACDVDHNRRLIESALDLAVEQGADWVVTPELCIPRLSIPGEDRDGLDIASARRLDAGILPSG